MDNVFALVIEQVGANLDYILTAVAGGVIVGLGWLFAQVAKLTKGDADDKAAQKFKDENK